MLNVGFGLGLVDEVGPPGGTMARVLVLEPPARRPPGRPRRMRVLPQRRPTAAWLQAIQARAPRTHTIVEAHPDVHARMLEQGWGSRPGVRVVFARWQDCLPHLGSFDGIFFDTFSGARWWRGWGEAAGCASGEQGA